MNLATRTSPLEPRTASPAPAPAVFDVLRSTAGVGRTKFKVRGSRFEHSASERGVALVVTLILLSIITFLAVAFLALSRRDRASVGTSTEQITASRMAEAALERAKTEMLAGILASSSPENYGARVSTNFNNPAGFRPGLGTGNLTNVNFDLLFGAPSPLGYLNLPPAATLELLGNLFYDPRVPVLVATNLVQGRSLYDFRFYLDLNRNGRFDPSLPGLLGDPEWIGMLERTDLPHGGNNRFLGRYSYLIQPIGQCLDLNAIHNEARTRALNLAGDGYWRNQNVGTWEINLPAFLTALNTNLWGRGPVDYQYDPVNGIFARGTAFEDAVQFLAYRYAGNYGSLQSFASLYPVRPPGVPPAQQFATDFVDGYSSGSLWTSLTRLGVDPDLGKAFLPWVGADNPNAFSSIQDVFDPAKVGPNFVNRLLSAGTNSDAYDAYTYYRMVQQLGTGSAPEEGKINLNNDNRVRGVTVGGLTYVASTNFLAWQPLDFFTNAAQRLLADLDLHDTNNVPITITNIPLYPNNYYTPAVHRALQLAANLYDATTNRWGDAYPNMPSVFRPRFGSDGTNIYIAGYLEVTRSAEFINNPVLDLEVPADRSSPLLSTNNPNPPNVYGVPLVIGAKKGLPNFNEFSLQNVISITRRIQMEKNAVGGPVLRTNQQYQLGVTHNAGVELWNSYSNDFPRDVTVIVANPRITLTLSNDLGVVLKKVTQTLPAPQTTLSKSVPAGTWKGFSEVLPTISFNIPWSTSFPFVTNAAVVSRPASLDETGVALDRNTFPIPRLYLNASANVQCLIADTATGHVIDYVSLTGLGQDRTVDVIGAAVGEYTLESRTSLPGSMWITNRMRGTALDADLPFGVLNQILVSQGLNSLPAPFGSGTPASPTDWQNYSDNRVAGFDRPKAIDEFLVFLGLSPITYPRSLVPNNKIVMQVPFTPTRKLRQDLTWQANDPLVHYTASDLTDLSHGSTLEILSPPNLPPALTNNLGQINTRYRPWGGNPNQSMDTNAFNLAFKDPLVRRSDNWNFPTNKFPNVGHIGRVHRGTPWQTVYLKSPDVNTNAWLLWTGDGLLVTNRNHVELDARLTIPTEDRKLFDIFTAAVNDNATLGQLSANQTNEAAWSAVLSGVVVLSNSAASVLNSGPQFAPLVIAPAAVDPNALPRIVNGIARTRKEQRGGEFSRPGDILSVPELTVESPFLNRSPAQLQYGIPDTVYERIPEQIMGLLRSGGPRFVVYAYGQALKPAPNAFAPGSQLCTNYQVTAEVAARAVVRVDRTFETNLVTGAVTTNYSSVVESYNLLPPD